jgi:2-dehydro-3-deoxyphosphooctonate aldolase (KDO 8-P synthase)
MKLDFFIGPCVLESEVLSHDIADFLKRELSEFSKDINLCFKGSFDKANRTSVKSYRGPGLEKGLMILETIKTKFSLPVVTDFHLPDQAQEVASVVDTLQIPAFLCRQTDMIISGGKACQKYGRQLKIKKGQFLSPEETENIVLKAENYIPRSKIILTERGTTFGYKNLVVDMASFQIMKSFGVRTVHDATHCVQQPGLLGTATGGKRDQIFTLAKAAVAAGADGVFLETHPEPSKALSDAATSLPLESLKPLIKILINIHKAINES